MVALPSGLTPARPGMSVGMANTVRSGDLRKLLESELSDPVLVLRAGRVEVVAGEDRGKEGLELISRADLVGSTGQATFSDDDLERRAVALTATTDTLGG